LALKHGLDLPSSAGVHAELHGEVTPVDALRRLMAREQKAEYPPGLFRTH
jgi:glycerol-3-phosphate dehydrogenase (NAD(P)+)